ISVLNINSRRHIRMVTQKFSQFCTAFQVIDLIGSGTRIATILYLNFVLLLVIGTALLCRQRR
uniref:Uncharacterized protein n=1 Tax=Oryza brachyantha TaxID=4533 RepID=J3M1N8_ORYBR